MKRFITGHSGFIGRHFRESVTGSKYLYNKGEPVEHVLRYQPDYIFHFAGEIYDESVMFDSNIVLTHKLLEYAKQLPNLRAFIYVGSSSEYGRKDHPMSETDLLEPTNMYEATKGAATLLCQAYAREYGVRVMIARPFSVYGKHEPKHRFIPTIQSRIKSNKVLKVSEGVHDFIHVTDFIGGLLTLTEVGKAGEIYNFGTGVQTSNIELVKIIESLMHKRANIERISPLHTYDSNSWVADISKARSLGWKPEIGLTEGLSRVIKETI
jgi:dTDP-glucose 4,6-dehydratase